VQSTFTRNNPQLQVHLRGLTAGHAYHFTVDGVNQADFTAASNGGAGLRFRLHPRAEQFPLDFDPRGHVLAVSDGTNDVLKMTYSGEGEPDQIAVDERTTLLPISDTVTGRVDARYLEQRNQDRFILHLHGITSGTYTVYVDGQPQTEFTQGHGRSTMVTYSANKRSVVKKPAHGKVNDRRPELDFDPRGVVVDIVKDGAIVYSGVMLAQVQGINKADPATAETTLTSTGVDADATATATLAVDDHATRTFSVEVQGLPVGDYSLLIGGTARGTLSVTDAITGAAQIEFSTEPETGEFLLDFDPSGQSIEIKQGTTSYFTGTVNGTLSPVVGPITTSETLPLLNQLVDADASAHATLVTDAVGVLSFDVSVANLPVGAYDLLLDGAAQGTITVAADGTGSIAFAQTPTGAELALTFDPRGHTVAVAQGGSIFLSRLF